jgi:hypothetical protein
MKEVLAFIEQKEREFAQLPLFQYMQDKSIDPLERLSFAPCLAPFVMNLGELNKYAFREEPTSNVIQAIINKNTYEDDHHWVWLLEDLEKLGFDRSRKFSDTLRFLWSEETKVSRLLSYELYRYTCQASAIQKFIVIETIETLGNVFLSACSRVIQELDPLSRQEYRYFGSGHLIVDTDHTYKHSSSENKGVIDSIQLTDDDRQEALELTHKVFGLCQDLTNELLAYAKKHRLEKPLQFA